MKIRLSCAACGYELDAQTGKIEADDDAVREAAGHLKHSAFSGKIRELFEGAEEISLERAIYRCRGCGEIHPILQTRSKRGGVMVCPSYTCKACGKALGKVKPADLKKLACPMCRALLSVEKHRESGENPDSSEKSIQPGYYLRKLSARQQMRIIDTVNCGKPFEECPEQSAAAKQFFDSLMRQKAELEPVAKENGLPGVIFDYPELDDDEESKALEAIMFEGMDLE